MTNNISYLEIKFDNGLNIKIENSKIEKLYISNVDKQGEEIPYNETILKNKFFANFMLIKLSELLNKEEFYLFKKNNIISTKLCMNNEKEFEFCPISDVNPFIEVKHNNYQKEYILNNSYAVIITEYKIKNLNNLLI